MCGHIGAYDDVISMPLGGRVRTIDRCIHHIVAALNAGGVETTACCCGHGIMSGSVLLEDGRMLVIMARDKADSMLRSERDAYDATQAAAT